jgi:hypothetical protein
MERLCKEVLQCFALSTKVEKSAKGDSERKGKEFQRAISAKDVEWQVWFEELAEQIAKLSKAGCLDADSIAEVKTRIASHSSTALLVMEKVAKATYLLLSTSPPTSGHRIRDPFPSPPPEKHEDEERQTSPPRHQWDNAPKYSADDRPELEIKESPWHTHPSDNQIFLVMKNNKQPMDKPKVYSGKTTDNFWVWHKSVKTYF